MAIDCSGSKSGPIVSCYSITLSKKWCISFYDIPSVTTLFRTTLPTAGVCYQVANEAGCDKFEKNEYSGRQIAGNKSD
eukprot:1902938-Ditylum_brightwellii.AAC.1